MTVYTQLSVLGTTHSASATWDSTSVTWNSLTDPWDGTTNTVIVDTTNITLKRSLSDNIGICRMEFDVPNWTGYNKSVFVVGEEVLLKADTVTPAVNIIFGGLISEVDFSGQGSNKETIHVICRDYTSLLQKNIVEPEVYINQEISVIMANLLVKYAPLNFTTGTVTTTSVTIPRITFKGVSLYDAIKQLSDLAGSNYVFYVDDTKQFFFINKGAKILSTARTASLTTTYVPPTFNKTNVVKSDVTIDAEAVKNRVFVYGARQFVQVPQESFTGDGAGSVFTLKYSPNNTKVQVNGVTKNGDLLSASTTISSGINYLVSYTDKQIIFVSGTSLGYSSIPGNGSAILVDYSRSTPIVKLAEDYTSINTYGKRSLQIVDEKITDASVATSIAKNQILLNKDPTGMINLRVKGLFDIDPGQSCVIDLPYETNFFGTGLLNFNAVECNYTFNTINNFSEQVLTIKVGRRVNTIVDIYKDIILAQRQLQAAQIDDSTINTRLLSGVGSYGLQIPLWYVKTRTIGQSLVYGHPINGKMGSPAVAINGSQITMGDFRSALSIIASGVT